MDIPLTVDRGDAVAHEPCKLGVVEECASNHEENGITGKRQISRNTESRHLIMWLRIRHFFCYSKAVAHCACLVKY